MASARRVWAFSTLLAASLFPGVAQGSCEVLSPARDAAVLQDLQVATVNAHGATVSWCRDGADYSLLVHVASSDHRFAGCPPLIVLREPSPLPFIAVLAQYRPPYDLGTLVGVTHERELVIPSPPPPIINVELGGAGYYLVCFHGEWWRNGYH